ncbi:hypothetical protein TNCT_421221 [Trichonephila clavata]|uniref:Dehydrogenase/reductase SDR family member 11 n=1 Tax=Trichonephila clavata TaxID=2740835 RepID=A0A8X6KL07_TRICU|nr:hypothetical protein TNCT_421221 [Trichonephila clavata]
MCKQDISEVNVMALCICSRKAVKLMREKDIDDGQIIHISSIGGHRMPTANFLGANFYCGTKFMVKALTEGLRKELKALKSRIRIASVSPGLVETQFLDSYLKNNTIKPADVYASLEALSTKDIADSVTYIMSAPPHVEIHDLLVLPVQEG